MKFTKKNSEWEILEEYGDGGGLFNTDKKAFVDSTLNANKNLEFVKRLYEKHPQTVQIPGQPYPSTHFMEYDSASARVYPTVVNKNGKLEYLGKGDPAYDYADSSKEYIQFPNPEQAMWFGSGYKQGTGVLPKHATGGSIHAPIIVHNPNDPRLRAYSDSLIAYNNGSGRYNIHNTPERQNEIETAARDLERINGVFPSDRTITNAGRAYYGFAQPTQPIVYRPKDNTVHAIDPGKPQQITQEDNRQLETNDNNTQFVPIKGNKVFSRKQQDSEVGGTQYFDSKTGKKVEFKKGGKIKSDWEII